MSLVKAMTSTTLLRAKTCADIEPKREYILPVLIGAPGTGKSAMMTAITPQLLLTLATETGSRFMPEHGQKQGESLANVLQSVDHIIVPITFNFASIGSYDLNTIRLALCLRVLWA